ncbi:MAG TPA: ATP-binding cassette domain-containing protein, partial [Proteiniclasticum sp.]|nr:ATP-binding cassette domain-containing protein [Proteiniclasticum sp.]
MEEKEAVFQVKNLDLWYGNTQALKKINFDIYKNEVTAIIGPSGCGKSTFIKTL